MIEMHYIFPTVIWKTNYRLQEKEEKDLIVFHDTIRHTTKRKNYSNNAWSSQDIFSKNEVFNPLKKIIEENINCLKNEIFKNYIIDLNNMWFNSHEMGMWNKLHSHGLCGLSGVYYLKCPEGSGKIVFERNLLEKNIIEECWQNCEMNFEPRQTMYEINPKEGDLLIFPSWLGHWVDRSMATDTRISVAFNLVLNGFSS